MQGAVQDAVQDRGEDRASRAALPKLVSGLALRGVLAVSALTLLCSVGIMLVPLFSMQVFNRVLTTRNVETLAALSLGLLIGLLTYAVLDWLRGIALSVLADRFVQRLSLPLLRASAASRSASGAEALRDLETLRQFIASPACLAPFELALSPVLALVYDMDVASGTAVELAPLADERAVYAVDHPIEIDGAMVDEFRLTLLEPGRTHALAAPRGGRVVLIGGTPLGYRFVSWNFVSSSRHEGGANAVSEALALGVPVLATAIPGSIGLLGEELPGLYPVGDARRLADLLLRAETDPAFLASLAARSCARCVYTRSSAISRRKIRPSAQSNATRTLRSRPGKRER